MSEPVPSLQVQRIIDAVCEVYLGPRPAVEFCVAALLARGHLLLEDVPGVGKTTLARQLAVQLGLSWARIQCTPDLLPSDVVGFSLPLSGDYTFRPGPVFSNVVLVDEINRAAPRTQSAFLEAMEENQVTIEGQTRPLPRPFFVIATQNPIEIAGTFPLPESQLDRFSLCLHLGYPPRAAEMRLLAEQGRRPEAAAAEPACTDLGPLWEAVDRVACSEPLLQYVLDVGEASRRHVSLRLGFSPRALIGWKKLACALAFIRGRDYVLPEDLTDLAGPALLHRILPNVEHRGLVALEPQAILQEILQSVPLPL